MRKLVTISDVSMEEMQAHGMFMFFVEGEDKSHAVVNSCLAFTGSWPEVLEKINNRKIEFMRKAK